MNLEKAMKIARALKSDVVNKSFGCADLAEYRFLVSRETYEEMMKGTEAIFNLHEPIKTLLGISVEIMNMPHGMEMALVKKHDIR